MEFNRTLNNIVDNLLDHSIDKVKNINNTQELFHIKMHSELVSLNVSPYTNLTFDQVGKAAYTDKEWMLHSKLSPTMDIVLSLYMIVIAGLSLTLNILVLATMCYRRHKLTNADIFIINLAVIDLTHTMFAHPQVIISGFKHTWLFGMFACEMYAAVVFFNGTCSISTLAAMSVLRYIKVCKPHIDGHMSMCLTVATLIPVYLNALIWAISPLLGWGVYGAEPYGLTCTVDWYRPSWSYIAAIFLFVYILPLGLMIFCYGSIYCTVHKSTVQSQLPQSKMNIYLAKICTVMCIGFFVAWTPYSIVALVYCFSPHTHIPIFLSVSAPYLAKSSTCYNPIVYFLAVRRFREDTKRMISHIVFKGSTNGAMLNNLSDDEETFPLKTMKRYNLANDNSKQKPISMCVLRLKRQLKLKRQNSSTTTDIFSKSYDSGFQMNIRNQLTTNNPNSHVCVQVNDSVTESEMHLNGEVVGGKEVSLELDGFNTDGSSTRDVIIKPGSNTANNDEWYNKLCVNNNPIYCLHQTDRTSSRDWLEVSHSLYNITDSACSEFIDLGPSIDTKSASIPLLLQ